jgi:ATP-dependent protease HslVU (ClpYQ) ATPase subunit
MSKIIGQDKLIKEVNRIFQVFVNSNCKIRPHFILTGESGSGKSFTIKQLCDMNELNFLEVNAAQITKEGISGNSLSKILSPLVNYSHTPIVVFVDEFDKLFINGNTNSQLANESTASVQNEYITSNTLSAPNISSSIFSKSKKPYYNILLDDRAGLEESYEILKYVVDEIKLNQQGNQ